MVVSVGAAENQDHISFEQMLTMLQALRVTAKLAGWLHALPFVAAERKQCFALDN